MTTRNGSVDENTKELIKEAVITSLLEFKLSMQDMNKNIVELSETMNGALLQQQFLTNELQKVKNGEGVINRNPQMQFGRLTKLDFHRFAGDDVKGWIYLCNQFLKLDNVQDEHKVHLASMHLHDKALAWHWQFIKIRGENVPWVEYEHEIVGRFGTVYKGSFS